MSTTSAVKVTVLWDTCSCDCEAKRSVPDEEKTLAEQLQWGERNKVVPEPKPEYKYKRPDNPKYIRYLSMKRLNYRELRKLGMSSKEAGLNCTKKRAKAILEGKDGE